MRLVGAFQDKIAERQKGYERHIVRHNHRPEIGYEYQRENDISHIFEFYYYLPRKYFEEPYIRQRFHHE